MRGHSHRYVRLGRMSAREFVKMIPSGPMPQYQHFLDFTFEGITYKVNMSATRYLIFRKSLSCVSCGVVATVADLERHKDGAPPRFNLYTKTGVLMTKDHILPSSRGGTGNINNLQTMCAICNNQKGNRLITNEELQHEVLKKTG